MAKEMPKEMTEMQLVGLVRNALLVAGTEMGESGDHWPVINDTIHSIAKDWEESRVQENVDAELKIHLYEQLGVMEKGLSDCSPSVQAELSPLLKELREACDAYFEPFDDKSAPIGDDEIPMHIKRAEAIIATLGGEHD